LSLKYFAGNFSAGVDVNPTDPLINRLFRAIQAVKRVVADSIDLPLDVALKVEREQAADTLLSGQCIKGISAFLEKRKPRWP
jgi:enoyl-CoA hydratase/carnithine racemase